MIFPGEFAASLDPWRSPPIWSASALCWAWGDRHWNKLPGGKITWDENMHQEKKNYLW